MKRNIVLAGVILLLVFLLVKGIDLESKEDYDSRAEDVITEDSETVTISIRCDTVLDHMDQLDPALKKEKYIPSDGVILEETPCVLKEGDSAFDILDRVCRQNHIPMEYMGPENNVYGSAYIQGIHHLYEFSCGKLSGWMLKINGEFPSKGCSNVYPEDKDQIEWVYTCDLGRDIGDTYMEGD